MKKSLRLGLSLFLILLSGSAFAEILIVNVKAHVVSLDDPSNVFGGQISVGQYASGKYSYETTVPDQAPYDSTYGQYPQSAQQGHMIFGIGAYSFESDATSPNWQFQAQVLGNVQWNYQDNFGVTSYANKSLPNGATVSTIDMELSDPSGVALNSDQLLTTAPDLSVFSGRTVYIYGAAADSTYWQMMLAIDSVEVAPVAEISPANGSFVRSQHIDPAVLLSTSVQPSNLRGAINGTPLSTSYTDQCQAVPANSQNRGGVVCPNIIPMLISGSNHVELTFDLPDGSTTTGTVDWQVID